MPKYSPNRAKRIQKDFGALGKAIKSKMSDVGNKGKRVLEDFGASKWTVDNAKNPASAYSMMSRKQKSMGQPTNFPN